LIKQWLKAGYMEKGVFHETPHGTPQGGVISPLLANIALHGMEEALGVKHDGQGRIRSPRASVRYADDFVVFCESKEDAEVVIQTLTSWLSQRGLTLSAEKTRIVHLSEGFDFLGFNVRHYPAPKTSRSGYKLLIKPSKSSVQKLRDKLRDTWRKWQGTSVEAVIQQLNPIIRGWANYFRSGVTSETFGKLDAYQFQREVRYAKRGHPNKPWHWIKTRYWGRWNPARQDHWVFGNKHTGHYLLKFAWFKIERHVLVKGTASPDDPNLRSYWLSREKATAKTLSPKWRRLAEKQGHVCGLCGASLFNGEELQLHHRKPRARGGEDIESNFVLVHLYCHQQIHSAGGRKIAKPGDERLLL
jgi:RNA-directed DNA polymerase